MLGPEGLWVTVNTVMVRPRHPMTSGLKRTAGKLNRVRSDDGHVFLKAFERRDPAPTSEVGKVVAQVDGVYELLVHDVCHSNSGVRGKGARMSKISDRKALEGCTVRELGGLASGRRERMKGEWGETISEQSWYRMVGVAGTLTKAAMYRATRKVTSSSL